MRIAGSRLKPSCRTAHRFLPQFPGCCSAGFPGESDEVSADRRSIRFARELGNVKQRWKLQEFDIKGSATGSEYPADGLSFRSCLPEPKIPAPVTRSWGVPSIIPVPRRVGAALVWPTRRRDCHSRRVAVPFLDPSDEPRSRAPFRPAKPRFAPAKRAPRETYSR